MKKIFQISLSLPILLSFACGGEVSHGGGDVTVQIENALKPKGIAALSVKSSNDPTEVTTIQMTVSGEGINPSVVKTVDAAAHRIEILGIPAGPNRTILLEALNGDGTVIRRRTIENVEIRPGVVTPIKTSLNTIPIVLNLKPGNVVLSSNFHVLGFGEPGSTIKVDAEGADQSIALNESEGGALVTVTPDISTGNFDLTPKNHLIGKQKITLTDQQNGESSSIDIYIIESNNRPGHRAVSAGGAGPYWVVGSGIGGLKTGNFPRVMQVLTNKSDKTVGGNNEKK